MTSNAKEIGYLGGPVVWSMLLRIQYRCDGEKETPGGEGKFHTRDRVANF
jgi:hypothetical protein